MRISINSKKWIINTKFDDINNNKTSLKNVFPGKNILKR